MINPDTFCIAPWLSTVITSDSILKPCCAYAGHIIELASDRFNSTNFDNWRNDKLGVIRNELLSGVKHSGCVQCWDQEKNGKLNSYRHHMNETFKNFINTEFDPNVLPGLKYAHFDFGNLCNLKCMQCTPAASSNIETEYKMNKVKLNVAGIEWNLPTDTNWYKSEKFSKFKEEYLNKLTHLFLTGGEPLMIPEALHFLDSMPSSYNIELLITTNGTTVSEKIIAILRKFKKVLITVSLEGIGKHNDYIRHGSKWETIHDNIIKLSSVATGNQINTHHVFQHTSVYSLVPLIKYVHTAHLHLNIGKYYGQEQFKTINSVAPDLVKKFVVELENLQESLHYNYRTRPAISQSLSYLKEYKYDEVLASKFKKYIATIDEIRGENFERSMSPL